VWVADPDGSIARIDPATHDVKTIPKLGAFAVATGDGAVWALAADGLHRIDPATDTASPAIPLQTTGATSMAVGAGAIWVADPERGLVVRVDPGPTVQEQTVSTALGASVVTFSSGRVWVADALGGTVIAIDPSVNRVVHTAAVNGAPQTATAGGGDLWVPVVGSGQPVAAIAAIPQAGDIQSSRCGPVFQAAAGGRPQFVIASDFPLTSDVAPSAVATAGAVRFVVQEHRFRAGRFTIGLQSCDASATNPAAWSAVCGANAHAYAQTPRVIGIVGPRASVCAHAEIPILNVAPGGPVAMVSPQNTNPSLTTDPKMFPSGTRNYARVVATDDRQVAADATLARQLGVQRPFIVQEQDQPGNDFFGPITTEFSKAATADGLTIAGTAIWVPGKSNDDAIVAQAQRSGADGVFLIVSADDPGAKTLVTSLRSGLGRKVPFISSDTFVPISDTLAKIGPAALGMYVSSTAPTNDQFSASGRQWARQFATTQPGGAVDQWAPLTAEATEVLLAAIARSDGTRASVTRELLKSSPPSGIYGPFAFTSTGDIDPAVITIIRIVGGNRPGPNFSSDFQGAVVDRTIDVPASP
jgi:branched-chain amino acid transport system substrate-binding protein